ncbi:hypothetical protein [Phenylobacterium sp.]|uniref:hypothetical protein n=1 Tax=Phenylobacterium sp. TaxID=1871053 RepID=UPI0025DD4878|nr:hypothetical protein [Phenylobacterium sp.]
MLAELRSLVLGLIVVAALTPVAVWAVQTAKRRRGGAALVTGLLLIVGMNSPILRPPPSLAEQIRRQAEGDIDEG